MNFVDAGVLKVAYEQHGDPHGEPIILLHGFPYDIGAFDEVVPIVTATGARAIVPYLRGFGPTRFLSTTTMRSGQQAALGTDLIALMDALHIERAVLAGFDWGGRAACVVAAIHPERTRGLVTVNGYNVNEIAKGGEPSTPENEHRYWYQFYFHGERGRAGLQADRRAFCRYLWKLWSPDWDFSDATFDRSAASFENPDFVDVVIHSYRHRFGLVAGDPAYDAMERRLAERPKIAVPCISFDGLSDAVMHAGGTAGHASQFTGGFEYRTLEGIGHNVPQEAPRAFADAILAIAG